MTSGPIVAMVLGRDNAIQQWRELIGPTNTNVAKETNPDRFDLILSDLNMWTIRF